MWNNAMGFNGNPSFPPMPAPPANPSQQVPMPMWGGWGVSQGPMMAPPYSMPMMIMPGANLQPPQYGWVGHQQLVQPPSQPKPPSDPNPPGTFAPPPPLPPETTSSAKPLFPGVLNDSKPPPPPGGPDLSAPPPPPPSEPEDKKPKPPAPVAPPVSKSAPPSFTGARNLEGLSAPPPPPPPDEDAHRDQGNSRWDRLGSGGPMGYLRGPDDGVPCSGVDSEYDDGYGGGGRWNGAGGGTGSESQSDCGDYGSGGAWDGRSGIGGGRPKAQDGGGSNSSSLSSGTWRCDGCQEVNFDSRVECKRCGFKDMKEKMNKLKNFDKMFDSWTESYNKWKLSNQDNPDKDYVANYTAQMEAMRHQLLDKRKGIQDGDHLLKPKPMASFGKRSLEDEVVEQKGHQVKRSRWEQDMDLDIESWRRPKQSEEDFWKPKAVKDYSQQGLPKRSEQEFRPSETFDYSQRDNNRQDWRGENWGAGRPPAGPGPGLGAGPWGPPSGGMNNRGFDRSSQSPASSNFRRGGGSPGGRPGPPPKPVGSQVRVDSLVQLPGRLSRPPRLAVILRGLPGAGKSHVAKLLKEKEAEQGAEPPRTMALDDYFECDGEYEYEAEMEAAYRGSLEKSFKKNVDGGLFPFLIVDAINEKVDHFRGMWSHAKQNGFEVYICEVDCDINTASERNVHGRTSKEVKNLSDCWEKTPDHMNTLDIRSLLQDDAIEHVDMEEEAGKDAEEVQHGATPDLDEGDEENSNEASFLSASKWEVSDNEARMAKLDGTTEKVKSRLAQHTSIEDWLELGDDYNKPSETGKKRVRWADLEEKKSQARREKMGFVVGGKNWASQSDRERSAQGALERTKFIPSRFQSEFHAQ